MELSKSLPRGIFCLKVLVEANQRRQWLLSYNSIAACSIIDINRSYLTPRWPFMRYIGKSSLEHSIESSADTRGWFGNSQSIPMNVWFIVTSSQKAFPAIDMHFSNAPLDFAYAYRAQKVETRVSRKIIRKIVSLEIWGMRSSACVNVATSFLDPRRNTGIV